MLFRSMKRKGKRRGVGVVSSFSQLGKQAVFDLLNTLGKRDVEQTRNIARQFDGLLV